MKRLITALLVLVLAFSAAGCKNESLQLKKIYKNIPSAQNYTKQLTGKEPVEVAKNDSYSLSVNPENGQFSVKSLLDGYIYYSTPAGIDEDTVSNDPVKNQARSVIKITFGDTINRITGEALSFLDSVILGGHKCYYADNGFLSVYTFSATKISVPVLVTLDNQGFEIQILTADVKEEGDYILTDASLLSHFGAGTMEDEGYAVVPDGSGAVIEFTNGKHEYPSFTLPMYGQDVAINDYSIENTRAYIPVFGIKNGEHGFVAVINKGDAHSYVNASVAGGMNNYNIAYASFAVRDRAVVGISATSTGYANKNSILFDEREQALNSVGVKYILLGKDGCDYTAMAKKYGEYLAGNYGMEKKAEKAVQLYLNMYCSARRNKNIFGVKTTEKLSTFSYDAIEKAVDELSADGEDNIAVFLNGWNESELSGDFKREFSPFKKSGGREGLEKLARALDKKNIPFFSMSDIFEIRPSNSFSARRINRKTIEAYPISLNTLKQDKTASAFSFISPAKLNAFCENIIEESLNYNIGFGAALSKTVLYSDFGDNYSKRQQTADYISKLFDSADKKGLELSAQQPAAYVVPYLDFALYLGGEFAHYDIEDYSIPFYQLAVSNYLGYSGEPINLSLNASIGVMKTLEYGGGLCYSLIGENGDIIFETDRAELYNCEYRLLKTEISEKKRIADEFYSKVGSTLNSHTRLDTDVYLSRYSNASAVFNYSKKDYVIGDLTVKAGSFAVLENEEVLG